MVERLLKQYIVAFKGGQSQNLWKGKGSGSSSLGDTLLVSKEYKTKKHTTWPRQYECA